MPDECVHDRSSLMARFDPRLKIVGMGLFSVLVAVMDKKAGLVFACVITLAMVFLSGLSLRDTVKRLLPVNSMVVFLWVFLPFSVKGQAVWGFGPFTASREGVDIAVLITLKANVMMLMFISFAATTEVMTAGRALALAVAELRGQYTLGHLFLPMGAPCSERARRMAGGLRNAGPGWCWGPATSRNR